jgi:calcineurin-like phosphoesterase family protein
VSTPRRAALGRAIGAMLIVVGAAGVAFGGLLVGRGLDSSGSASPTAAVPAGPGPSAAIGQPSSPTGETAVLVGAGDIASCSSSRDEQTAKLVEAIPGVVFTAGDNAYPVGSEAQFRGCYGPSWGRFRDRTRPASGNHDVITGDGAPYFAYFGVAAGTAQEGWYSYEAGTWHVIVLNSNCLNVGGCTEGSRQLDWLTADLAAHPVACTLAIWHHPRFSSGAHGSDPRSGAFWRVLYDAGADLIVTGHDHDYERFAPQTPAGVLDPGRGIRQFVVGTGGDTLRLFKPVVVPNSEVRNASVHGVLRLDLAPGGYTWQFIAVPGRSFSDNGSAACH